MVHYNKTSKIQASPTIKNTISLDKKSLYPNGASSLTLCLKNIDKNPICIVSHFELSINKQNYTSFRQAHQSGKGEEQSTMPLEQADNIAFGIETSEAVCE